MRKVLFAIMAIGVIACSSNKNEAKVEKKHSIAEQNAVLARTGYVISHGKCYDKGVDIEPIIKLRANTINQGEVFSGKAYYPTNYFDKLAKCYNLNYKIKLSISNMLMPLEAQGRNQDTVFFKVSPDSLTKVKQGKKNDEYELRAGLRASFSDGVSGYDTTAMATKIRLFVRKP